MERRTFLGVVGASAGTAFGSRGLYRSAERATQTRTGDTLAGISVGPDETDRLEKFGRWAGTSHAVVVRYATLGGDDDEIAATCETLTERWNEGAVPQLVLQPLFGTVEETSDQIAAEIAAGDHDDRIDAWAEQLGEWTNRGLGRPNRRLYLTFAPEMNGDWLPWAPPANETTPEEYVAMWRRVRRRFGEQGLEPNELQWIWSPNVTGRGGIPLSEYYPGDAHVEWVGINGYNWSRWGQWSEPEKLYGTAVEKVREVTDRPLALTEMACSSAVDGGFDPERKDQWITDLYDFAAAEDIKMVCWFNHEKETDWSVFGGERGTETVRVDGESVHAYGAYRRALNRPGVLGPHPKSARNLTDAEFRGDF